MKIWLLENDNRTGPHEIFDVRDRISSGELTGDTPAWYEGAGDWTTLDQVPAYSSYFKKPASMVLIEEEEKRISEPIDSLEKELAESGIRPDLPDFQNESLEPVRRFFARLFDIFFYTVLLVIIKIKMGDNPFIPDSVFRGVVEYVPYLLLDGFALTHLGTTPGKWLLNIRLRSQYGHNLDIATSLIRSVRVWVLGFALGSIFAVIALPIAYFIGSQYGRFLWDIPQNNVTLCGEIRPARLLGYIFLFMGLLSLLITSIPIEMMPPELLEKWKQK